MFIKNAIQENTKSLFYGCVGMGCCKAIVEMLLSVLLAKIIDAFAYRGKSDLVWYFLACILIFLLTNYVYKSLYCRYLKQSVLSLRQALFQRQMGALSFQKQSLGTSLSSLTNDVSVLEDKYLVYRIRIVPECFVVVLALAYMVYLNVYLTLLAIVFVSIPLLVSTFLTPKLAEEENAVSQKTQAFIDGLYEYFDAKYTILQSAKKEQYYHTMSTQNETLEEEKERRFHKQLQLGFTMAIGNFCCQFGFIVVAGILSFYQPNLTAGIVLLFAEVMQYFFTLVNDLPMCIASTQTLAHFEDNLEQAFTATPDTGKSICSIGDITLENVQLGYEDKVVLDHINVTFKQGKKYALLGGSGSGKSTLFHALEKNIEPKAGTIYVDQTDLNAVSFESLYQHLNVIHQEVFIFNDTLKNNITLFQDVPNEELVRAIDKAELKELVKEVGLDYVCGTKGDKLSGGQKQRIALARAFLFPKDAILLDEATSALDSKLQAKVTSEIMEQDNQTIIAILHQVDEAILKMFDEIIVLHQGEIVEQGSYDALMQEKNYLYSYIKIWGDAG